MMTTIHEPESTLNERRLASAEKDKTFRELVELALRSVEERDSDKALERLFLARKLTPSLDAYAAVTEIIKHVIRDV